MGTRNIESQRDGLEDEAADRRPGTGLIASTVTLEDVTLIIHLSDDGR